MFYDRYVELPDYMADMRHAAGQRAAAAPSAGRRALLPEVSDLERGRLQVAGPLGFLGIKGLAGRAEWAVLASMCLFGLLVLCCFLMAIQYCSIVIMRR